ncbi:MAG: transglycosylase SLT domain-containing protein [Cyanobacteria bacterium NC_groundwater_1444_Ag_S-0.65um_54_12]|nr:transglycosylase SLT domain-containing protein [Cyanobacteria bacterium NC_groundwater_1444_Ag_S-0.65um_54_12]
MTIATAQRTRRQERFFNPPKAKIKSMLLAAAIRHGIPPAILLALAEKESHWTHFTAAGKVLRGSCGPAQQGIMQINELAHPKAFPRARKDMQYNIDYGAALLEQHYQRYQNWPEAIAAYNRGSVKRRGKKGQLVNQHYVQDVLLLTKRHVIPYTPLEQT